jgi:hypothetical protein
MKNPYALFESVIAEMASSGNVQVIVDRVSNRPVDIHDGFKRIYQYAKSKTAEELYLLIKGLVLYTQSYQQCSGGSVSPIRVLLEEFQSKDPEREPELTSWIVDNRVNVYDPWGGRKFSEARSFREYYDRLSVDNFRRESNLRMEHARQEYSALRKDHPDFASQPPDHNSDQAILDLMTLDIFDIESPRPKRGLK